ncbi:MAG TPA: hypothetical protein DCQ68_01840 [Chryseobacterium indologenes]|nr:hypothetical protein [Chryseobacterium indologenes]
MRKLIIILLLITKFTSCSTERDNDERDPKYLIEVNFEKGIVNEGGKQLEPASPEISEICENEIKLSIPGIDNPNVKILCFGSGESNERYYYIFISSKSEYYLTTSKSEKYQTHIVKNYEQRNCLKRWIKSKH